MEAFLLKIIPVAINVNITAALRVDSDAPVRIAKNQRPDIIINNLNNFDFFI